MPASSVAHPLGPPTVSGNNITVDTALNQPTRVTRMIMDLTLQRFIADRVFASGGGVTGGALIYDKVQANELYTERDVERVAPGGEFPILTDERLAPAIAEVEKWGGKVWISDEARDRNNVAAFTNQVRKIANTVVRKINAITVAHLEASITASGNSVVGNDWSVATPTGPDAGQSTAQQLPLADLARIAQLTEEDELGISYNLLLINPQEYANLLIGSGSPANLTSILSAMQLEVFVSNRVTAGTAYVLASGQVGEMRIEKPLGTEAWRQPERERSWVQSSVRPLFAVTNDFAVRKLTGLAG